MYIKGPEGNHIGENPIALPSSTFADRAELKIIYDEPHHFFKEDIAT